MTIWYSSAIMDARLQLIASAIDSGPGAGMILFYDGTRPATANGPLGSDNHLIVAAPFQKPCAPSAPSPLHVLALAMAVPIAITRTGNPSWARLVNSDQVFIADMDVGIPGSGADIIIEATKTRWYEGGELVSQTLTVFV